MELKIDKTDKQFLICPATCLVLLG